MPSARHTWQLYPGNRSKRLDGRLFHTPPAEYRGTPFWSWNCRLSFPQLRRQIDQFRKMGFGGVHIHSRTGLATEYLGREFMSLAKRCHAHLKKRGMLTWLYDEDRWPSGFAGGLVSHEERFREKTLLWTPRRDDSIGTLLARYNVALTDGRIASHRRLSSHDGDTGETWHAYLRTAKPDSWFNQQTYIDTFNRAAVERFVSVTHERYREAIGKDFGKSVPSIFTDEPHFTKKQTFANADQPRDVVLPFSDDFCESFHKQFKIDLLDDLPELFWDRADGAASIVRYRYHEHTAERFASSFGDTIAAWCKKHQLALTGHMLSEATLFGQSRAVGEVMRGLRSFQLPGIDMLEDKIELTTAKQAQSVTRQNGRPGVLSELYGVTNWDFDFAGHKRQGDWQAALGVTVRVPHLAWVSMAGESKRDYPAAIGYQSPWYREYKLVEDHFARVATVLSRGRPLVRVAVIHPIESFWLLWGPADQNGEAWKRREQQFQDITRWLTFGGIDFDFVSEAALSPPPGTPGGGEGEGERQMAQLRLPSSALPPTPSLSTRRGSGFAVGKMRYDAVIVPNLLTMRATTLARLKQFASSGGTIIFAGDVPTLVDVQPSTVAQSLAAHCKQVAFDEESILAAVEPFREVRITHPDRTPTTSIAHQIRIDGDERYLFLCNTLRRDDVGPVTIALNGRWNVERLDTLTGEIALIEADITGNSTIIRWQCVAHDHVLLRLKPGGRTGGTDIPVCVSNSKRSKAKPLPIHAAITLSEPNTLLLDQAEWRLNDEARWHPREELLRLDNLARKQLNLPPRGGRDAQPWTDTAPDPVVGTLHLRFTINSTIPVKLPMLAMEDPKHAAIRLNGKPVTGKPVGWWVDESIRTVRLPTLKKGRHTLEIAIPMRRRTNVEWCYLLGDFGVRVRGRSATIIPPPRTLKFGDWTHQGLPFYAGNVTYHLPTTGDGRRLTLRASHFSNPLLTVAVDGRRIGPIAFAPHELSLGKIRGKRTLQITAYGNRHNAFGPLHHTKRDLTWVGPAAWRSEGEWWSYDYHFKPIGILQPPSLLIESPTT